ncbi:TonB-dependent receptor [Hymenobacter sp. DH14]|uniref:TonB-dependent receptor n=1 Tax=Hymenobacter cyanobacteriorum TaxID=2926463 RepID=A0A9X1VEK2_9BACT|nr:outer membrane beta-barrel family protein [Hymenobacter cyanobacteriorum]MCI1187471.1 TonB-dependent receptor [Hymenobacter cyanobacteriorum]
MPDFTPSLHCLAPSYSLVTRQLPLLLLGLVPLAGVAQQTAPLIGTVRSETGAPIEFVTLTLHRAADSVVIKTEFSDVQGQFRFDALVGGRYLLSAAQIGYGRYWSPALAVPAAGLVLPAIGLRPSAATALKEITVTARKPLYEHQAGGTRVNVADSPLATGATALEVLGRAPGISTDGKENLSLRGRQGLLVVVDGKRVPLTGADLADYLKALPAEQMQSIELLTNPPAQYDAQGGAGVIAITLKKDQRLGTNGSATLSVGRGGYGRITGGLVLNHRRKNLNLYGNYTYSERRYFTRYDFDRQYAGTSLLPAAASQQFNDQVSHLRSHAAKVGADCTLSKRTLLGASLTGLLSHIDNSVDTQSEFRMLDGSPLSRYTSVTAQNIDRPSGSANLNLRHALADSANAAAFTFDADYGRYHTTRLMAQQANYLEPQYAVNQFDGDQRVDLSIGTLKLDFSQPLPHRARLEAGAKATRVRSDNSTAFFSTMNGTTTFNPFISKDFRYAENVNAAYVSVRTATAQTTVQAGLRAEQTNTLAELSGEAARERHYTQLFPSLSAQRTLNARHALALALARRIDRPNYGQLNPLRFYVDPISYRAGNPDLVAQTSYSAELTHTYRQKFVTALAYARTDQPIVTTAQPSPDGGRLVVSQDVNLASQDYLALTLTAPLEPTKWWSMYANGVFYYLRFRGQLAGTQLNRAQPSCQLSLSNTFSLPRGWSAELSGNYQSSEIWGFEKSTGRGQVGAGLLKSFWNKQGSLRFGATDIFYTSPARFTSTFVNFRETFYKREDLRVVTGTFTYRFGNGKVAAARKRAAGAEDELRRAGGL